MIEKIITFSAKNRNLIIILFIVLIIWGIYSIKNLPIDAVPDLSDVQVIIYTEWPGQSPTVIEEQLTYPIVSTLISAPKVRDVRGFSALNYSLIYVIFEDNTDIYWARSRVLEYMNSVKLPSGVKPTLGPDATSVGWIYQYALYDESGQNNLADLRTIQDWYVKYDLLEVDGVAEVASIGGFVKEYQIQVDPEKLFTFKITMKDLIDRVVKSNRETGGRVLEVSGREFMIRSNSYVNGIKDLEKIVVSTDKSGIPVLLKSVASVQLGSGMRRGIADLNGSGEAVGGIVVMRYNENAYEVIKNVKKKLAEIKNNLPEGVNIETVYDRSNLIKRAIDTINSKLIEESIIVLLVCLLFLFHIRSTFVIIIMLPTSIIISFILFKLFNITSNIMSLGGIAIAIGTMVDAAIVMVENAHKSLEGENSRNRREIIIKAACYVGRPIFFSLLVITVSFIPIFSLTGQEGRMFKPLAYTKTFSMLIASFVSITLVPVLMTFLLKGKIIKESQNPISRFSIFLYKPIIELALKFRYLFLLIAIISILISIPIYLKLGSEFMPALDEGDIFYMPTTLPGISASEAKKSLRLQDELIKSVFEVETVFGKVGRADTATDPAPLSMAETVIKLKPKSQWREGYSIDKIISELNEKVQIPGWSNSWTMPIKARLDMLSTGMKTPVGIKIYGDDPATLEQLGMELERIILPIKGTRSVFAERTNQGYYLIIKPDRLKLARNGMTIEDVNLIVESALGAKEITTTVEGRERYPVTIRYAKSFREDIEDIRNILVPNINNKLQLPLSEIADIYYEKGPDMLRDENGMLVSYVYIDLDSGVDIGTYVKRLKGALVDKFNLPENYRYKISGQYENMQKAKERLKFIIPLTLFLIFMLFYFNFKNITDTLIIMFSIPFALTGSFWYLYYLNFNMSVAVWVGIIALAGVAAETGAIMLVYLNEAFENRLSSSGITNDIELRDVIIEGSVLRVRPKLMTVFTLIFGLLPILWSNETGADVVKRIAAPMIGGTVSSIILTLVIIPVIYYLIKKHQLNKKEL
jgi:Cu(I)/Ag(I) efflux system membrane protein CusA/SilA